MGDRPWTMVRLGDAMVGLALILGVVAGIDAIRGWPLSTALNDAYHVWQHGQR